MKNSTLAAVVVIIIAIIGLGWWWYAKAPAPTFIPADTTQTSGTDQGQPDTGVTASVDVGTAPTQVAVAYGANGFNPSTITVAKGSTVTFIAGAGAGQMWVASDPHPSHTGYDGTGRTTHCAAGYTGAKPFDQCSTGTTFSFTFDKTGTFGYHNHFNDSAKGTIVVK
ncbi:MAG: plastocyanin/azurin family copper-binding protein [Patescibacteria group bacterium]